VTRQLFLRFEGGPTATATLHTDLASKTVDLLWEALAEPVEVTAVHAMFAGPEIMTGLPAKAQTFDPAEMPVENQTCFPSAGDLLWYYQAPNQMKGLEDEMWEIGLFYGEGGRIFGPLGWTPCNIFGSVTEGLEEFAAACADTRISGAKTLTIGRVE
jgi:hypothetical protein